MKRIIIIGAGFAGLSAAKRLSKYCRGFEILLFDKRAKSDFLPLIPDCIGRGIDPQVLSCDIARSCRKLKIEFIQEEVNSVDFKSKQVSTQGSAYAYDFLIISSGSQTNFFSDQNAHDYGFALNSVTDAKSIIKALGENKFDNFIICGGGYTGVETATNLWLYFKKKGLAKKIIIVERAAMILGALPTWIRSYVEDNLKVMSIEVMTNSVIEKIQENKIMLSAERNFPHAMLIWVPGVKTADFIARLTVDKNPQGRIVVDKYLKVNEHCFCAGDTAFFNKDNNALRMAVAFAIAQGDHAAKNIINSLRNLPAEEFRPVDLGYIIPMANNRSAGIVFGLNVKGVLPTCLHFIMCIFRLAGVRNKIHVINNLIKGR
jgi:NADH:ubiquinone reductase (H+-translocating)